MDFRKIMNELSAEYLVQDANLEDASIIFILESPHIQEVKNGVPVAGASGATMTKHLIHQKEKQAPLGLLVKQFVEERDVPKVSNIGLMNICQLPMQRTAYKEADREGLEAFFDVVEGVRTANHKKEYKNEMWNNFQEIIIHHFLKRLKELEGKPCTLIPCGRFAQKFFGLAQSEADASKWTVIHDVPHPSYNSWSRDRYQQAVKDVQAAYQQTIEMG